MRAKVKSGHGWWVLLLLFLQAPRAASAGEAMAFYDPDANHAAIAQITGWFNNFLLSVDGDLNFRPVVRQAEFERSLEDGETHLAIVSSEYLRLRKGAPIVPILVPTHNGETHYRKLLLDKGAGRSGALAGKRIAAAFTAAGDERAAAKKVLALLADGGVDVRGAFVTLVPKDIDALFALSFGQVDAALVTPSSLALLARRNPQAAKSFRTVFETRPILRSPLCVVDNRVSADERAHLVELFSQMAEHEDGKRAMFVLGFDSWVPFRPGMLER